MLTRSQNAIHRTYGKCLLQSFPAELVKQNWIVRLVWFDNGKPGNHTKIYHVYVCIYIYRAILVEGAIIMWMWPPPEVLVVLINHIQPPKDCYNGSVIEQCGQKTPRENNVKFHGPQVNSDESPAWDKAIWGWFPLSIIPMTCACKVRPYIR